MVYRNGLQALFFGLLSITGMCKAQCTLEITKLDDTNYQLDLEIPLKDNDFLYSDYLSISTDNPEIQVSPWHSQTPVVMHFDTTLQDSKRAFGQNASLTMHVQALNIKDLQSANLHVTYYVESAQTTIHEVIPLKPHLTIPAPTELETQIDIPTQIDVQGTESAEPIKKTSWSQWLSQTINNSDSWFMRLIIAFLLGLLMSLTPCIYPMIPITAGILQAQKSRSLLSSFLLALSYTVGIATTFAVLGLLAAFAGQAMGQFMNHPAFIIPLVIILVYLSFSMIGLYDMYIPRFLQPSGNHASGGSFISAFIFGAISGIVASPCLSPGLVSLLLIVTTIGNKILGFLLLFSFGIGLGIPLLIIGTFSSSLTVLPRAGMWMVEIKKLFGYLMLGMCLYFLNYIVPSSLMQWIVVATLAIVGGIFLYYAKHHYKVWRLIYSLLGMILIATAFFFGLKTIQSSIVPINENTRSTWQTHYSAAQSQAIEQQKPLFVDIGAPFCSICKAIDSSLFTDQQVRSFLEANTIPVKIDGSHADNAELMKQFNVLGFPTVLLLESATSRVIKSWGPELYGMNPQQFIDDIRKALE